MSELDRTAFDTTLSLLAARLPAAKANKFMKEDAKDFIVRLRGIGAVNPDTSNEYRRVLLRTGDRSSLPEELLEVVKRNDGELVEHDVKVGYDYWSADQILQAVLPEDLLDESPTAFTQVGHIAHVNLREQYLPHRHLIGQVILDKNKGLRTVVNKLDTIDSVYRNFQMEVLAGDPDFLVELSEHDCRFRFDFSKVYWNSRLQTEHARLVDSFKPTDVVVDGFAGVGPFAIPAGKKGCAVSASDLNPASAEALAENVKLNKVEKNVRAFEDDGRHFIQTSILKIWNDPFSPYVPAMTSREAKRRARAQREARAAAAAAAPSALSEPPASSTAPPADLPAYLSSSLSSSDSAPSKLAGRPRRLPNHYIMNLPASALTFLDAFNGLFRPLYDLVGEEVVKRAVEEAGGLPIVHCYCFTKEVEEAEKDICARATEALGHRVDPSLPDFALRYVRDVAPNKAMYCLEFRLTKEMVR
ncbi:tRNA(m(1)G37)methyltransferase [Rhodotorula toruloides]